MSHQPRNALGQAHSAYLRSAAQEPVDWREWGEAAFEQACQQVKPILLDIGVVQSRELRAGLAATLPHLPLERTPLALVCVGASCRPPVESPGALREALESAG